MHPSSRSSRSHIPRPPSATTLSQRQQQQQHSRSSSGSAAQSQPSMQHTFTSVAAAPTLLTRKSSIAAKSRTVATKKVKLQVAGDDDGNDGEEATTKAAKSRPKSGAYGKLGTALATSSSQEASAATRGEVVSFAGTKATTSDGGAMEAQETEHGSEHERQRAPGDLRNAPTHIWEEGDDGSKRNKNRRGDEHSEDTESHTDNDENNSSGSGDSSSEEEEERETPEQRAARLALEEAARQQREAQELERRAKQLALAYYDSLPKLLPNVQRDALLATLKVFGLDSVESATATSATPTADSNSSAGVVVVVPVTMVMRLWATTFGILPATTKLFLMEMSDCGFLCVIGADGNPEWSWTEENRNELEASTKPFRLLIHGTAEVCTGPGSSTAGSASLTRIQSASHLGGRAGRGGRSSGGGPSEMLRKVREEMEALERGDTHTLVPAPPNPAAAAAAAQQQRGSTAGGSSSGAPTSSSTHLEAPQHQRRRTSATSSSSRPPQHLQQQHHQSAASPPRGSRSYRGSRSSAGNSGQQQQHPQELRSSATSATGGGAVGPALGGAALQLGEDAEAFEGELHLYGGDATLTLTAAQLGLCVSKSRDPSCRVLWARFQGQKSAGELAIPMKKTMPIQDDEDVETTRGEEEGTGGGVYEDVLLHQQVVQGYRRACGCSLPRKLLQRLLILDNNATHRAISATTTTAATNCHLENTQIWFIWGPRDGYFVRNVERHLRRSIEGSSSMATTAEQTSEKKEKEEEQQGSSSSSSSSFSAVLLWRLAMILDAQEDLWLALLPNLPSEALRYFLKHLKKKDASAEALRSDKMAQTAETLHTLETPSKEESEKEKEKEQLGAVTQQQGEAEPQSPSSTPQSPTDVPGASIIQTADTSMIRDAPTTHAGGARSLFDEHDDDDDSLLSATQAKTRQPSRVSASAADRYTVSKKKDADARKQRAAQISDALVYFGKGHIATSVYASHMCPRGTAYTATAELRKGDSGDNDGDDRDDDDMLFALPDDGSVSPGAREPSAELAASFDDESTAAMFETTDSGSLSAARSGSIAAPAGGSNLLLQLNQALRDSTRLFHFVIACVAYHLPTYESIFYTALSSAPTPLTCISRMLFSDCDANILFDIPQMLECAVHRIVEQRWSEGATELCRANCHAVSQLVWMKEEADQENPLLSWSTIRSSLITPHYLFADSFFQEPIVFANSTTTTKATTRSGIWCVPHSTLSSWQLVMRVLRLVIASPSFRSAAPATNSNAERSPFDR